MCGAGGKGGTHTECIYSQSILQSLAFWSEFLTWFCMFDQNIARLARAVERRAFIRPFSQHRLPDGTLDVEGNLRLWNAALEPFLTVPLWGKDVCAGELQGEPCLVPIPAQEETTKPTILIAHGGGFRLRTGCEAANVALCFHKAGYPTAILAYRLAPHKRMEAIEDMQRAIRLLRTQGASIGLSTRIVLMGFSAGGMLAANCATHFDLGNPAQEDVIERASSRPDAGVVCYGAMSATAFPMQFGNEPDAILFGESAKERFYFSAERHVRIDTPPLFIWQTMGDDGRYGMALASAMQAANAPYELHIFQAGAHGLALADGENDLNSVVESVSRWPELCIGWLKENGL